MSTGWQGGTCTSISVLAVAVRGSQFFLRRPPGLTVTQIVCAQQAVDTCGCSQAENRACVSL